ncbi:Ser-Thr-rich GPI-anchored membrane family protein [Thermoflexibacter ruber]|uniref:Ser-Thr-rich glycosyl-phosphatidyl-inositol-anchored membrane family protein n=1 Tax=Thermoflexibacter ruber TaxID=1003 RepID=A0A1I2DJ42_9BACT|nr:Ser-Thr-rich GPI-anchored membrane family protein [Thermoflexibacter ruber]SFE80253.1 Ser-Thr-rich glycosyl-phosphatidyl-inositol-anchored membrane family protein [Thermoflexibacter ruber]
MKKIFFTHYIILLLSLFAHQVVAQAPITIISPNGGESLSVGSPYNISWNFTPTTPAQDVFTIELLIGNTPYSIIANNVSANTFTWNVPNTLPERNDYRIRVSRTNNSAVNDLSDANFSILGGRVIRINTPNNTSVLTRGANFNITWLATFTDNFKIDLLQNGTVLTTISNATTGNLFTWTVPLMISVGNNYQIRITSIADPFVFAESNLFVIEQSIRLTSPNGGQSYAKGSSQTITWTTSSNITAAENVKIDLVSNGNVVQTILASTPNTGTANWTVPNVADGGNYKIRISLVSNANVIDESDDTFAIGVFVRVTSPTRGQVWNTGSTYQVRWTTNVLALLRVELILAGAVVRIIGNNIPSNTQSSIDFSVPSDLSNNDGYTVRVISLADANQQGSSEPFAILSPPTITVTAPQGGETWQKKKTYDITWQSGVAGNVRIDLLKNNVLTQTISNSTPNANRKFTWEVPTNIPSANDYRIRVSSLSLTNVIGQSQANFTIADADSIRITNPTAGLNAVIGTEVNITWTTNFGGNVIIELLRNGVFFTTLTNNTPNNGRFTWTVPATVNDIPIETGNFFRIRIRTADNAISENSPLFSIVAPSFQISSPNGGEQLVRGFTYPIIWLSNVQGGVKIDLYNNNFTFIRTLAQEATGGRFEWTVPNDLPEGNIYSIRITSLTNTNLITNSAGNFTILQGRLQVTVPIAAQTWYSNGFTYRIDWTNNTQRPVRVDLLRGSTVVQNIAVNLLANTTNFTLPELPEGTDYRIRVSSMENPTLVSESPLVRILRPTITVNFPRGGESLIQELRHQIQWTSNLPAEELVKIDLYIGDIFNRVIASSVENNGTFSWNIGTNVPVGSNYRIRVSVANVPNVFGTSASNFSIIRDNIPPVISDEIFPALFDASRGDITSIDPSFNVTDNLGTDGLTVNCIYRSISNAPNTTQGGWTTVNARFENGRYAASIPYNIFRGDIGVEYYIQATDRVGNTTTSPANGRNNPRLAHIRYNNQLIPDLIFGENVESYQIIAIPLELNDKSVRGILEDDLGTYDDQAWRLLHYQSGELYEVNKQEKPLTQLDPGKGYWLIIKEKPIENVDTGEGTTVRVSSANPFSINLNPGWNQIGNPYNYNLSWSDILAANQNAGSLGSLKVYEKGFKNTDVLRRYRGGFVFSATGGTLRFPTLKNASINSGGRIEEKELLTNPITAPHWEVRLTAKIGKTSNEFAGLGMNPKAEILKDEFDDMTLPRFGKYVEVNFNRPAYFYPKFTKDIVPTTDNFIWEFTVESNENEKLTTLSWDNSYFGNEKQLILFDQELQRMVDMKEVSEYAFARTVDKYRFKVFYGDQQFIQENLNADKVIFTNFPNPFSSQTQFNFTLPLSLADSHVSIKVYNALGQEVATLANQSYQAGFHNLTWEGRDAQATPLSKGLYVVRLQITNTDKGISQVLHRSIIIE